MIQQIGKYRILQQIGRGGMGTVYKAHDPMLDRRVALKVISGDLELTDELRARFFREAQACARLSHPNVVTVYDMGDEDGHLYIVMEFLEGDELRHFIAQRRDIALEDKLAIMIEVCDGLDYAHKRGIIHRDIKPGNIYILRDSHVKLLDFGIARFATADANLTRTGLVMGTLRYMSPEQARGQVDHRSDIFSVGAVFYEFLTYRHAFAGTNPIEILERLRADDPAPLTEIDPSLPVELAEIIARALRKNPADRYAELAHMRHELERVRRSLTEEAARLRAQLLARFEEINRLRTTLTERLGQSCAGATVTALEGPAGLETLANLARESVAEAARLRGIAEQAEALQPAYEEAVAALNAGRVEEAVRNLERIAAELPDHLRAAQALDRAREAQAAIAKERERVAGLLRQAEAALQRGQPEPGLEALRGVGEVPAWAAEAGAEVERLRAALERALAEERTRQEQEAERAQAAHTEARRQADAESAATYAAAQWAAAEAKAAESRSAWTRGAHVESTALSAAAVELYDRASQSAAAARQALGRARAQADQAAAHATAARGRAENARAARHAPAAWEAAVRRHHEATVAQSQEEYAGAAQLFTEAAQAYDGAAATAREGAQTEARRVEGLVREAGTLFQAARWTEALARLQEALALTPGHTGAAELRARVDVAVAMASQERERVAALLSQAERELAQGQPARGLELLRQVGEVPAGVEDLGAEVERLHVAAARAVARAVDEARGRAEEAVARLSVARRRAETVQAARYATSEWAAAAATQQEGMAAQGQQRYEDAERFFQEAAARYERAASAAAEVAAAQARRAEALTREAAVLVESGQWAGALGCLEEALTLAPEHSEAHRLRARVETARAGAAREQERIAARLREAEAALEQGQPRRARDLMRGVGESPPAGLGAEVERVRAAVERGLDAEKARQETERRTLERLRARAEEVANQTAAARGRAERASAARYAPAAWAVAVDRQQEAIGAEGRREYEAAAGLFAEAGRDFDRAVRAALEGAGATTEPVPLATQRRLSPLAIGIGAAAVLMVSLTVYWRVFSTAPSPVPAPLVPSAPADKRPTEPAPGGLEAVDRLRKQVTAGRQAAIVAGAERRAAAAFEAATARERAADAAFKQRDWTAARSAYLDAKSGYEAAATEAAALVQQEQDSQRARELMSAARRAADVGGAERLAKAPWARASATQNAAETAFKQAEFGKAAALFAESARGYRDAEKVAAENKAAETERAQLEEVRRRLQGAELAAVDAANARRSAEQAGALRYAPKTFALARQKEDAGRKGLDSREYERAESRLREAARDYQASRQEAERAAEAERQAIAARQREEAEKAAEAERQAIAAARQRQETEKAAEAERQAIAARQRQETEKAAEAERQAIAARQRQETEKAAEAERQAIAARQRQETEKAAEAERQAIAARQRQETEKAAEAERQAIAARQRQEAEQMRARALASREEAVKAGANVFVKDVFGSARARETEADRLAGRLDMLAARQAYQDAADGYGEAGRRARLLQEAKAGADQARARMAAAKERGRTDTTEWNAAVVQERQGTQHYQRFAFREAGESFAAATELFARATARPPERPPGPAPADEVRAVLDAYVRAFETKDIALMQKVRPGLKPEDIRRLRDAFDQSKEYRVSLRVDSLNVSGDTAVVQGRREDNLVSKSGQAFRNESSFTFRLRRTNAGWVIDAVN